MKKLNLTLIVFFTIISFSSTAQIEVATDGHVSIGDITPDTYQLRVEGTTKIKPGSSTSVIIDNTGYYNNPAIYGGTNIGKSNATWYQVYSQYVYETSDGRQKENIREVSGALSLIEKLQAVKYDFKTESTVFNSIKDQIDENELDNLRKNRVGFIAQDVEKVIPEAVYYDEDSDIYSIDYTKIIPFLVEAIKEQQNEIAALKLKVANLESLE